MHFGSVVEIVSSALCKGARFSLNKIDFNIFKAGKIKDVRKWSEETKTNRNLNLAGR